MQPVEAAVGGAGEDGQASDGDEGNSPGLHGNALSRERFGDTPPAGPRGAPPLTVRGQSPASLSFRVRIGVAAPLH